jgi:hypothetical protein
MMSDQARVSLVARGTGALSCKLCTAETHTPDATVVVRHPRGGVVQLAACDSADHGSGSQLGVEPVRGAELEDLQLTCQRITGGVHQYHWD